VIIHTNPPELVDSVMLHPLTIVASDGHIAKGKGHPRGAGTYARVLARYVRDQGRLSLMDAIRKAALMPAQRLEGVAMGARRKGRVQEGADADITVFDAKTVQDRSSYERPLRVRRRHAGGRRGKSRRRSVPGQGAGPPIALARVRLLLLDAPLFDQLSGQAAPGLHVTTDNPPGSPKRIAQRVPLATPPQL
jgi:N-acyl-D-aspartate/D-glutamate deacylase